MDMMEMCDYFRDTVRKEKVANEFELFSSAARVRVNKILVNTNIFITLFHLCRYTTKSSKSLERSFT